MMMDLVKSDSFWNWFFLFVGGVLVGVVSYAIYNTKLALLQSIQKTYMATMNGKFEELKTQYTELKTYMDGINTDQKANKDALQQVEEKADDIKELVEKNTK